LTIEQPRSAYHAVIIACGASADLATWKYTRGSRRSHTATKFVGWYNGQPDFRDRRFDFSGKHAVNIG
jgi:ferredoxin/flavodoxin---NADP+ reductase